MQCGKVFEVELGTSETFFDRFPQWSGEILAADRNDVLMSVRMAPFRRQTLKKMKKMLDL